MELNEINPLPSHVLIIERRNPAGELDFYMPYFETVVKAYCKWYAFIEHNEDYSELTGEIRSEHIHLIMNLKARQRPLTLARKLAKDLGIDIVRISIEPLRNENLATQYLIHANNPEKAQYHISEIVSNDMERVKDNITDENNRPPLTANRLISIVQENKNKLTILRIIGLGNFTKYHRVINMLLEELLPGDGSRYDF